jgi:hypothetical protein
MPTAVKNTAGASARVPRRGRHAGKMSTLSLRTLREAAAKTQVQVSEASGIPQGEISRIENRLDLEPLQLATLRRYLEALGGTLELVVSFPTGHRFRVGAGGPKTED